ncbi:CD40 [Branchiostoma lanceolatum]|uniref:CD40 protein n=1 Tax=Branchiostoma lanceolatum TaxID=7740 RepID=A0A8K0ES50_BRALA|nr:CD40 [Branchiostoma lanceolatum]
MHTLVATMGRIPTKAVWTLVLALWLGTFAQAVVACPQGMYSAWGGNWCCTSKCGPGTSIVRSCSHGNPHDTVCEDCGSDFYNPYPDQFHCRQKDACNKPNEEVKVHGNSTANNECQCRIGFHNVHVAELCLSGPVCQPGSGATRTGTCETCPHGTFSNLTSRIQPCIEWQSCGMLGFLQHRPGTNTSDAVCISHPIDVLLPTERPEIIIITYKGDANNTDSMIGGKQLAYNPTIIGISVGVSATVIVVILVLVLCCCRDTQQETDLENGQQSGSKTPLSQPETGAENKDGDVDMEMEPLSGQYRQPTEEMEKLAACPPVPDDGIETGDDTSMSDTLSNLSREGGAEPSSDVEETDPKQGRMRTMQYSHLIAVDVATTEYIVDRLGDKFLDLATSLPLRKGCSFLKTDLDSLKYTCTFFGLREAIRETVNKWRSMQGEEASLEGLLVGLTACGEHGMVKELCRMNNARRPNKGKGHVTTATSVSSERNKPLAQTDL